MSTFEPPILLSSTASRSPSGRVSAPSNILSWFSTGAEETRARMRADHRSKRRGKKTTYEWTSSPAMTAAREEAEVASFDG